MALTKYEVRFGCFCILGLIATPFLLIALFIAWDFVEPESWKAKESADDFLEMVISPCPRTMIYVRTLDYGEGTIAGDAAYCTAAYTLTPQDFQVILQAHKWVTPHTVSAETSFHEAWPNYQGEIESYYYDEGDKGASDLSGYSIILAVSKDHTKLVYSANDAWARPFDSPKSAK